MDCCFKDGNKRFRYRACAIIIEDGEVLFAKNDLDDYYYSVGGGVKLGEMVEEAVIREVKEETGIEYEIDRLVFFHENFFEGKGGTLDGIIQHEICFYFLMKPKGIKTFNCKSMTTSGGHEEMCWLPIDKLAQYKAFPQFLSEKLINLSDGVEHIITKDI